MHNRIRVWLALVLALISVGGCAVREPNLIGEVDASIVLEDTPFHPQSDHQCGPAALAMLLGASGVKTRPEDLAPYTYLPERKGSLQLELLAAARLNGRIPYVIDPDVPAVIAELKAGRPVLVLQNLGLKSLPAYHYAVVIGTLPPDKIILRSGGQRRLTIDLDTFRATWRRAGNWGMIALQPGEMPAIPDRHRYLNAVSAFESSGNIEQATRSYQEACSTWPEDQTALLALGNNYLSQDRYKEAERLYREVLTRNPANIAASNNLAETLSRQGCYANALIAAEQAVQAAETAASPLQEQVTRTRDEIIQRLEDAASPSAPDCGPPAAK